MEKLMQYVWQFRLWPIRDMVTVDGRRIEVIDPGVLNHDSGPDFFNAKLIIGGEQWVGNVEIHVRATDWHRHGHDKDLAYDSVVLHVVECDDAPIYRSNGELIPQMVMVCARDYASRYNEMVNNPLRELSCSDEIGKLTSLQRTDWLTALAFERLYTKVDRIRDLHSRFCGNWADVTYTTIARALGFGHNSQPFELLALSTPLKHLLRHSDSLDSLEAMLFGQAGLLEGIDPDGDGYPSKLAKEYRFFATKFGLRRSPNISWKMARMRPQNFPHRRIATLALLLYGSFSMASRILDITDEESARSLFRLNHMGYWARHFNFSDSNASTVTALSQASITVLIINVVVPLLYAYGDICGDQRRCDIAVGLLQELKPERNSIIDLFARAGIDAPDAFTSQALIHLRNEYCLPRKCLYCRFGHSFLSAKVKP